MVEVAPLKAYEYDLTRVDLASAVSPPFDVIGEAELKRLRKASPHNVVHLTLGTGEKKIKDRFAHAAKLLDEWIDQGILREAPSGIYAYQAEHEHAGHAYRMRGAVLRLKLDPTYKSVVPHEEIFPKPTEERIKLLRATGWDLEPIQLLYSGKTVEGTLWAYLDGTGRAPDFLTSLNGVVHKLWRVTDPAVLGTIQEGFRGRKVLIADGHHRYAAACQYAAERRAREYRPSKDAPWEYKLALLVHLQDPGLLILPTHRIVKKAKVSEPTRLVDAWREDFDLHVVPVDTANPLTALQARMDAENINNVPVVGAWLGEPARAYVMVPKARMVPEAVAPGRTQTWRTLDVVFLQKFLLEKAMGVPPAKWGDQVTYSRDDAEAAEWVRRKKAVAVLTHLPTKLAQMRAVAEAGEKMPQKSTYFLPKMLSGAVFHRIGRPEGPPRARRITS